MQYALIIYENENAAYPAGDQDPAWKAVIEAHNAFASELARKGLLRGGSGLHKTDMATTVRRAGGAATVHDGPFAETREQLGGFYLIEAADLDEAMGWARKLPLSPLGGSVEVRPCLDMPEPA